MYWVAGSRLGRVYHFPDAGVRALSDSASLARGRHLAEVIGKCPICHAPDYGGKVLADNVAFGRLSAGNLTSGRGGIGGGRRPPPPAAPPPPRPARGATP